MRRARVIVFIAVLAAFGVAAATGWLLAPRQPGDVRELIASYLTDVDAAREKYSDALVTASGVVKWSARDDEITSRRADHFIEKSDKATVLVIVDDRHEILAAFDPENQREALALRKGERVTITGRHHGGFFTGNVWRGKVLLTLSGCEFVR
jgi:tRNA_anti-like